MRDELNPADNYGYLVTGLCCIGAAGVILAFVLCRSIGWL